MIVASATAISFALWHGVNRALLESDNETDRREIASGYRGDCAFTAVTRLFLLLDRNRNQVSFQTIYARLQFDEVVTALLTNLNEGSFWTPSDTEHVLMPALTRKRVIDCPETWHVRYASVRVVVIVERSGAPPSSNQWELHCGSGPVPDWVMADPQVAQFVFSQWPALILMQIKTETPNKGYSVVSASTDD